MLSGLNKRGDIFVQSLTLTLLSVFAILFVLIYFKGKNPSSGDADDSQGAENGLYSDEYDNVRDLNRLIKSWKNDADLVIVGHLAKTGENSSETIMGGYGFFDLVVDSVERGQYPYDSITVYVGWFPTFPPPEQYPLYVRQRYYPGQRMRIFLNRDENGGYGYYTPGAYYMIEATM